MFQFSKVWHQLLIAVPVPKPERFVLPEADAALDVVAINMAKQTL
jgi:hypothetical protein